MRSFLSPLVDADLEGFHLKNERTGALIASRLRTAFDSTSRRRGLLGETSLPEGEALLIAPSNAVHTFGMQFPIDVAFVARDGRVVKTRASLAPRRIAGALFAHCVIEMSEGTLARTGTRAGDRLVIALR